MFWKKKKGKDGQETAKDTPETAKPSREEIIARAKANMASARA